MQSAYIETAELKGLSAFDIIRKHALPNAIAPIVNVVMLNLAGLVVGVVVVEVIIFYPGLGQYLVDHVAKRAGRPGRRSHLRRGLYRPQCRYGHFGHRCQPPPQASEIGKAMFDFRISASAPASASSSPRCSSSAPFSPR